jgi:hypothetical protein
MHYLVLIVQEKQPPGVDGQTGLTVQDINDGACGLY